MTDDESTERDRMALDAANWVIGAAHRAGLHGLRRDVADAIVTELAGHPALLAAGFGDVRALTAACREIAAERDQALADALRVQAERDALRAQVAAVEALTREWLAQADLTGSERKWREGRLRAALASQPTPAAEGGASAGRKLWLCRIGWHSQTFLDCAAYVSATRCAKCHAWVDPAKGAAVDAARKKRPTTPAAEGEGRY